jgi:hypothetical protein
VIDGEVLAWDRAGEAPLSFARLQPRIGRKTVPKKLLAEAPVILMAYDLLEWGGRGLAREAAVGAARAAWGHRRPARRHARSASPPAWRPPTGPTLPRRASKAAISAPRG